MNPKFQLIPLTKLEINESKTSFGQSIKSGLLNWKLLIFFIPVLLLTISLRKYFDFEIGINELLPLFALFIFVVIGRLVISNYERKLGYKKVGHFPVTIKADLFFIRILFLKNSFPLILAPQNDLFSLIKIGDIITLEKTGLNRLINWKRA